MDWSDLFSWNQRRSNSSHPGGTNQYGRNEEKLLTVSNGAHSEFLKRTRTSIQYLLTTSPVDILELDETGLYTIW